MKKIILFFIINMMMFSLECPIVFPLTGKIKKGYKDGNHQCLDEKNQLILSFAIKNNKTEKIEVKKIRENEFVFIGEYKNDKRNGTFLSNSNLVYESITSFEKGIFEKINIDGFDEVVDYYAYETKTKATFKNDILDGIYQVLDKNGMELYETVISNGTGKIKEYYNNGSLFREYNVKNNKIDGLFKYYYDTGVLAKEINYENGIKNGIYKQYSSNGNLSKNGEYKKDLEDGITYNYRKGKISSKVNYESGKFNGVRIIYYENGNINFKSNYIDNNLDGLTEAYYENGKLKYKVNFKEGKLIGRYQVYDGNNKIIYEKDIKNKNEKVMVLDKNNNLIEKDISKDNITQYIR